MLKPGLPLQGKSTTPGLHISLEGNLKHGARKTRCSCVCVCVKIVIRTLVSQCPFPLNLNRPQTFRTPIALNIELSALKMSLTQPPNTGTLKTQKPTGTTHTHTHTYHQTTSTSQYAGGAFSHAPKPARGSRAPTRGRARCGFRTPGKRNTAAKACAWREPRSETKEGPWLGDPR